MTSPTLRDELTSRLVEQCGFVCTTGDEAPIADAVTARYDERGDRVERVGNSVVVGARTSDRPLIVLVGHLDVVPPTDADRDPRVTVRDGADVVVGRGTSDMKSGNVVAMTLFEDDDLRARAAYDLALVFYAGEEGPAENNELADVLAQVSWLTEASLAVVLEPTDGQVQLGCLGGLHALVTFPGRAAHSARPWHGRNALTAAGAFLANLNDDHVVDVDVDGIAYRDVWSATQAWTTGLGPAPRSAAPPPRNILPDTFTINLNFRFAPSRDLHAAEAELRERCGDDVAVEIVDRSPPAPPRLDAPAVRDFVAAVDVPVAGKQAWTDVARFAERGIPALNFGPGRTDQAHQRGEFVEVDALVTAHTRLTRFLVPQ
ncbi:MAG: succinyl-diaminopimelate desuccinylase [Nitriliruptoraceae bacterium]